MFVRIVLGALTRNRARVAVALAAFFVTAAMASAAGHVLVDAEAKMRRELRGTGPNLIVYPCGSWMSQEMAERIGGTPVVLGVVTVQDGGRKRTVTLCGRDVPPAGAAVEGTWQCVPGGDLIFESPLRIRNAQGRETSVEVTGRVRAGTEEDRWLFVKLHKSQEILGMPGRVSLVELQVPGGVDEVKRRARELEERFGVRAEPVYRIARTEEALAVKLRWVFGSIVAALLLNAAICLGATLAASVTAREREMALMMSLGAGAPRIVGLLVAESLLIAAGGTALGYAAGLPVAAELMEFVFGETLRIRPAVGAAMAAGAALTAAAAVVVASARALRVRPAAVLKGE